MDSKQPKDLYKYTIILDFPPPTATTQKIKEVLDQGSFKHNSVEQVAPEDYAKFGIKTDFRVSRHGGSKAKQDKVSDVFFVVAFAQKAEALALAHNILFEKNVLICEKKLHMMLHNKKGNYNSETSIVVSKLNYACTE